MRLHLLPTSEKWYQHESASTCGFHDPHPSFAASVQKPSRQDGHSLGLPASRSAQLGAPAEILSPGWALPSTMTGQPGSVSPGTSLGESREQQPNWSEAEWELPCVRGAICKNADVTSQTQDRIPPCHRRAALSLAPGLPLGLLSLFDKAWALRLWEFQKTFQFLFVLSFLLQYHDTHLLILSPLNCLHCTYQHLNLFYNISWLFILHLTSQSSTFYVWLCSPIIQLSFTLFKNFILFEK